jgi:ATP-binding cassette subfamily C (CFTR/MRP) protein 1
VVSPILTFAVFTIIAQKKGDGATLDTAKVFTSLSLFSLLSEPLGSLIMALAGFMGGVGSFQRIQAFLSSNSRLDKRKLPLLRNSIDTISDVGCDSDNESKKTRSSLKLRELNFSASQAVVIDKGYFGWDKEKQPQLQSINMIVPRAKLTMVVGPVGCGKSTLLKAILGELPVMGGTVQISSHRIGLCEQSPWHISGTVQKSIIGVSDFDQRWYASVVRACALDEDLCQFPRGDQTEIGSKGIGLSGGQSQRIVRHLPILTPLTSSLILLTLPLR